MIINLTKNTFLELDTEWKQLRGGYNWYSFTLVNIYFENDKFTGGHEYVFTLLGFILRVRHNTAEFYRKEAEWMKEAKKCTKRTKKKKKKVV